MIKGRTATFSIAADGAISYPWRLNGVPLIDGPKFGGDSTTMLTVSGVTNAEAGVYDVQFVGACNPLRSQSAMLGVNPLHERCPSSFATAANCGAGGGPISPAIGDVNGDGRPDLAAANFGVNNVSVVLIDGPSIGFSTLPASQSVAAGDTVVFTATATGTGPFTDQWRRDGVPIVGATTDSLTVPNLTMSSVGVYDVQVSGACNPTAIATSHPAALTIGICKGDFNDESMFDALDIQGIVNALLAGETCR